MSRLPNKRHNIILVLGVSYEEDAIFPAHRSYARPTPSPLQNTNGISGIVTRSCPMIHFDCDTPSATLTTLHWTHHIIIWLPRQQTTTSTTTQQTYYDFDVSAEPRIGVETQAQRWMARESVHSQQTKTCHLHQRRREQRNNGKFSHGAARNDGHHNAETIEDVIVSHTAEEASSFKAKESCGNFW